MSFLGNHITLYISYVQQRGSEGVYQNAGMAGAVLLSILNMLNVKN